MCDRGGERSQAKKKKEKHSCTARRKDHQTVREGNAKVGSRPILDFGGKVDVADIMESAELERVGPLLAQVSAPKVWPSLDM